ncbi:MAG: AAA family ATPase, partial [Mycobacterium sp.]|nr:AAA family ATPase [Mycobacterium sp.]
MSRLFLPGCTVIRKEPLGHDARRRLQREVWMLQRLRGVTGVIQLLDAPRYPGSIILEDAGGTSLAESTKPLAVETLIGVALKLAQAVSAMHGHGVMHRDIAPANVVLGADNSPLLVDFALATSLAEIRPEFTHHSQVLGTLGYLAPEQTGRTGRPVDQRADLYALGATLYELATGAPPFGSGDPLRLTHDHLARVPAAPADVNPAVPGPVSKIILHLLEKEPDDRYQSADGLIHDLQQWRDAGANAGTVLRVGERDVPARLLPPSRLVERDTEVATLKAAFDNSLAGECRGVLVSGAPGVGKTALVDELRPTVTGSDGWFVTGKFDQFRRDLEFDAIYQAFRALGRLLLAEPPDELAELRQRLLAALGPNAGLATAVQPEFAALLGVPPEPGDPLTAQVRARRTAVDVLRAVASRKRPVILFVDDLQWAGRVPISVIDTVVSEEQIEGLLVVAAYRDDDVDMAHPLAAALARWREQPGLQHVQLANLPSPSLATLLAEMLHADQGDVAGLADAIAPHTHGNPYETVELLNTLRRENRLTLTSTGWHWDEKALRSYLDQFELTALPVARFHAMPPASRELVEVMACLGGRTRLGVLQTASGLSAGVMEQRLAPPLDEGLLVMESGVGEAVRFRHDRIREAFLARLNGQRRGSLQLQLARRLAAVPDLFAVAAEQYIAVIDAVDDAQERRHVMPLLRRAAEQAALVANYPLAEKLLTAALRIVDPSDTATLVELHTGRHAALYTLSRMEEADEDYRTIERLCTTALQRVDATCVQVLSLTNRKLFAEAIELGLDALRELDVEVPSADHLLAVLNRQFDYLYRWLSRSDVADDLARREITDPRLLAVTRLLNTVFPTVFLVGDVLQGWVSLEAVRIWVEHGTARSVLGPASYSAFVTIGLRDDYAAAYQTLRRLLALGEARGYEPETSQVRYLFSHLSYWFEPIEFGVQQGERAREGLVAGGDLATAGYAFHVNDGQLDCIPTLDGYVAEADAALAFVQRAGSEHTGQWIAAYRWLAGVLLGESSARGGDAIRIPLDGTADSPVALFFRHLGCAIAAAIFDHSTDLAEHTAAAMQFLHAVVGLYGTAVARLLWGLALAAGARSSHGEERVAQLSELEDVTRWLAACAADAPMNFLHLLRLLEAERAWAVGDLHAAALAFDAARAQAAVQQRP